MSGAGISAGATRPITAAAAGAQSARWTTGATAAPATATTTLVSVLSAQ